MSFACRETGMQWERLTANQAQHQARRRLQAPCGSITGGGWGVGVCEKMAFLNVLLAVPCRIHCVAGCAL